MVPRSIRKNPSLPLLGAALISGSVTQSKVLRVTTQLGPAEASAFGTQTGILPAAAGNKDALRFSGASEESVARLEPDSVGKH